jgi:hypothetical protein
MNMTVLALVAMICGPVKMNNVMIEAKTKNCYKDIIQCIDRKSNHRHDLLDHELVPIVEACVLEM